MGAQGQAPSDLCLAVNGIPLRRNPNVSTSHPKGGHHRRTRKDHSRQERPRKITPAEAARQRSAPRRAEGEQAGPSSTRRRRPRSRWFALGSSRTALLSEGVTLIRCLGGLSRMKRLWTGYHHPQLKKWQSRLMRPQADRHQPPRLLHFDLYAIPHSTLRANNS